MMATEYQVWTLAFKVAGVGFLLAVLVISIRDMWRR